MHQRITSASLNQSQKHAGINFSHDEVNKKYSIPLLRDLQHLFFDVFDTTENAVTKCYIFFKSNYLHLFLDPHLNIRTRTKTLFILNFPVTFRLFVMIGKVHLIFGNNRIFLVMVKFMMSAEKRKECRKHLTQILESN